MDQATDEENIWKHRILLENTPHGNIAMFYDLYRQAFTYYSDKHVSYSVLNLCAMKYVRIFLCRDFFVDTTILPVSFVNPFNKMKEEEESRLKMKSLAKRKDLRINFDSSSFVKPLKNAISYETKKKESQKESIYKNNFRCIGKLSGDWNILQPLPHTKKYIQDDYNHVQTTEINKPVSVKSTYSLWKSVVTLAK